MSKLRVLSIVIMLFLCGTLGCTVSLAERKECTSLCSSVDMSYIGTKRWPTETQAVCTCETILPKKVKGK